MMYQSTLAVDTPHIHTVCSRHPCDTRWLVTMSHHVHMHSGGSGPVVGLSTSVCTSVCVCVYARHCTHAHAPPSHSLRCHRCSSFLCPSSEPVSVVAAISVHLWWREGEREGPHAVFAAQPETHRSSQIIGSGCSMGNGPPEMDVQLMWLPAGANHTGPCATPSLPHPNPLCQPASDRNSIRGSVQ